MNDLEESTGSAQIRKRGLKCAILGFVMFAAVLVVVYLLALKNIPARLPLIGAGFPFAYFCIGVIELVSGRPYRQFAGAWMSLKGWQRGVLGTFLILAGLVIFLLIGAAVGMALSH